jgi:hypothetical protein
MGAAKQGQSRGSHGLFTGNGSRRPLASVTLTESPVVTAAVSPVPSSGAVGGCPHKGVGVQLEEAQRNTASSLGNAAAHVSSVGEGVPHRGAVRSWHLLPGATLSHRTVTAEGHTDKGPQGSPQKSTPIPRGRFKGTIISRVCICAESVSSQGSAPSTMSHGAPVL